MWKHVQYFVKKIQTNRQHNRKTFSIKTFSLLKGSKQQTLQKNRTF